MSAVRAQQTAIAMERVYDLKRFEGISDVLVQETGPTKTT